MGLFEGVFAIGRAVKTLRDISHTASLDFASRRRQACRVISGSERATRSTCHRAGGATHIVLEFDYEALHIQPSFSRSIFYAIDS